MQDILTYIALALAIGFLVKTYFFKSKKKNDCSTGCGSC